MQPGEFEYESFRVLEKRGHPVERFDPFEFHERFPAFAPDRFHDGFLFYYFGNVDQVSHMMWRPRDPQHPAYDAEIDRPYEHVVEDLYVGLDAIVGDTLRALGKDDLLVVLSDHGFASWRRSFQDLQ